jgi:hypothetical protein
VLASNGALHAALVTALAQPDPHTDLNQNVTRP